MAVMKATMEMSRTCVSLDNDVDNVDTMWTWPLAAAQRSVCHLTGLIESQPQSTAHLDSCPNITQESPGQHRLTK